MRSAQSEHPGRFVLVESDDDLTLEQLAATTTLDEPRLRITNSRYEAPRLTRAGTAPIPAQEEITWDPDGTVLITGGSGTLAGIVARHLAAGQKARHLLLVSRSAPDEALLEELAGLGAEVDTAACDVSDRTALAQVLADVPPEHPLTAVIHTAGLPDDGVVESLTPERFETVLRPKADAAWHLHELTRHTHLTAFILYSSAAGVMGNAGQANYAAANAFLDALAEQRQAEGLPGQSLAWGLWEDTSGLTAKLTGTDQDRMRRGGAHALTAEHGMHLFATATATHTHHHPLLLATPITPTPNTDTPALLKTLFPKTTRRSATTTASDNTSAQWPTGLTPEDRRAALLKLVQDTAAAVLGHAGAGTIPVTAAFKDLGLDSLTAVELRNGLGKSTGLRLPATMVFDYPTPDALAARLDELLNPRISSTALLAELDRIEGMFESVTFDEKQASVVKDRLGSVISKWQQISRQEDVAAVALADADAGEILDFIDREFGNPTI